MSEPAGQSRTEEYMGHFLSAYKQRGEWVCKIYDGLMKPVCEINAGCQTATGCLGHAREWVEQRIRDMTSKLEERAIQRQDLTGREIEDADK